MSSAPAVILANIHISSDKGNFILGLNTAANNRYIQGNNAFRVTMLCL